MKSYRRKGFKGLIRYGQARCAMVGGLWANLQRLERAGHYTSREAMETRASAIRRLTRKRVG